MIKAGIVCGYTSNVNENNWIPLSKLYILSLILYQKLIDGLAFETRLFKKKNFAQTDD